MLERDPIVGQRLAVDRFELERLRILESSPGRGSR